MTNTAPLAGIVASQPSRQHPPPQPWFNGKPSGWRLEDGVLRRTIRGSRHLLRLPPAISFDAFWYERLRPSFSAIEVSDREEGIVYRLAADDFDRLRERLDRNHGVQWYVELHHWTVGYQEGHQLALGLFGAVAGS